MFQSRNALLESFTERAIEARAADALGVHVSVGDVDISTDDKVITIRDLEIANPDGFEAPYAFFAKGMRVKLGDISPNLIVAKDVNISKIKVYYTAQSGGSNLVQIRENLDAYQERQAKLPQSDFNWTINQAGLSKPKVIIDRFYFDGARVIPKLKIVAGQGVDTSVGLSAIELLNIGRDQGGVDLDIAMEEILLIFNGRVRLAVVRAGLFEGLTQVGLMAITGGIPIFGVSDEILSFIGLGGDDDDDDDRDIFKEREAPKSLSETLNE